MADGDKIGRMSTAISSERQAIIRTLRDFCDAEIRPNVMKWDEAQEFPSEVFRKLGDLGFLGVLFPEKLGGAELSYMDYQAIIEEVSCADPSVALSLAAHNSLGSNHIYQFGTDAQRQKYIPKLASGEWLAAWGLTESEAGSDSSGTRTTAVRDGETWVLNGSKNFITNASVGRVAVLMAVTDRSKGNKGISAFIVELDNPGIRVGKKENKLGMRASDTCTLVMEDCRVPAANLLGSLGSGWVDSMKILDGGRISIAALSVGLARGAYEAALSYSRERKQFGKAISEFQGISFQLADMATEIEAGKHLMFHAAWLAQHKKPFSKEAAMAKLFCSELAMRATTKAVQVFGGYGYTKDYPVERMMRDAKICEIGEGTSEIQRLVIGRHILKEITG
jgi:alkylation response protein AidB-like acyl-CoA dehydrogenase